MRERLTLLVLAVLASGSASGAEMFEAPLDCVQPRQQLVRSFCADPQLLALARDSQNSLAKAQIRLKAHPTLLATVVANTNDFVANLRSSFDLDSMQPAHALRRHKAMLDAVTPPSGNSLTGAWASAANDLVIAGDRKMSAKLRAWGFGQRAYDCLWNTAIRPVRGGWKSDAGRKDRDDAAFYVQMKRQGPALQVDVPKQSERAPDDCPPWASFSGLYAPVDAAAQIDRLPSSIIEPEAVKAEIPSSMADFLRLLPAAPFAEHAPDLNREVLFALLGGASVEGWTIVRPKPDAIVIGRSVGSDSVTFQYADADKTVVEAIAFHKDRWHLAEWRLRADRATVFFSTPSLLNSVLRLMLSSRGGFRDGLPRAGLSTTDLTDDLRQHIDRLSACRYFGVLRKAGPSLPQKEIDMNRASSKCDELPALEAGIRQARGKYPDSMRILDLANQLVDE